MVLRRRVGADPSVQPSPPAAESTSPVRYVLASHSRATLGRVTRRCSTGPTKRSERRLACRAWSAVTNDALHVDGDVDPITHCERALALPVSPRHGPDVGKRLLVVIGELGATLDRHVIGPVLEAEADPWIATKVAVLDAAGQGVEEDHVVPVRVEGEPDHRLARHAVLADGGHHREAQLP